MVLLSWRDVMRLCFLVISYKEVVVRKNVMVSISSLLAGDHLGCLTVNIP